MDNAPARRKAGCVDGGVQRQTYEGFDTSELNDKNQAGNYNRSFN